MFKNYELDPDVYIETDFGGMALGLVSQGLGVTILPFSYSYGALPNVRFIILPYKINLYVTWRRNDNSSMLKNILQQVSETAGSYFAEGDR